MYYSRSKLKLKIEELAKLRNGVWYQEIEFEPGIRSYAADRSGGIPVWKVIKEKYLPESLYGMRVLDLGCNAGMYCVESALMGAKEVVGIEMKDIWYQQALFVKSYFEEKHDIKLNIRYLKEKATPALIRSLGKFDFVLAIAILYHLEKHEQKEVVQSLAEATNKVIVRYRSNYPQHKNAEVVINKYFLDVGFKASSRYPLKGNRFFIAYGK